MLGRDLQVKTSEIGAFVDIGTEVQGFVHISQLSEGFVESVAKVVAAGDEVEVVVTKIDGNSLGLSMKEARQFAQQALEAAESENGACHS
jgi:predicted RNA-binding protein with RPS1 domain